LTPTGPKPEVYKLFDKIRNAKISTKQMVLDLKLPQNQPKNKPILVEKKQFFHYIDKKSAD
jgi:hypothetical protein